MSPQTSLEPQGQGTTPSLPTQTSPSLSYLREQHRRPLSCAGKIPSRHLGLPLSPLRVHTGCRAPLCPTGLLLSSSCAEDPSPVHCPTAAAGRAPGAGFPAGAGSSLHIDTPGGRINSFSLFGKLPDLPCRPFSFLRFSALCKDSSSPKFFVPWSSEGRPP